MEIESYQLWQVKHVIVLTILLKYPFSLETSQKYCLHTVTTDHTEHNSSTYNVNSSLFFARL